MPFSQRFEEGGVCSELSWRSRGWTEGLAQPHWVLGRILPTPAMGTVLPGLGTSARRAAGDNPPRQKRDAVANHTDPLCCSINFILPLFPLIPPPPPPPCFQRGKYHVLSIPLTPWGSPGTPARTRGRQDAVIWQQSGAEARCPPAFQWVVPGFGGNQPLKSKRNFAPHLMNAFYACGRGGVFYFLSSLGFKS